MQQKTYIIAEAGVNHNGSVELARKLIEEADRAGADAVKFQTFRAETVAVNAAPKAAYQMETTDGSESQLDMLKRLELPIESYKELIDLCRKKNIDFLSTPGDVESLHFLTDICGLPTIKIGSTGVTCSAFLVEIGRTGKKVILSTGMSTLGDIELALGSLAYGYMQWEKTPKSECDLLSAYAEAQVMGVLRDKVRLMHCTTEYPAPFDEVNLTAMDTLRNSFGLQVGYSDHTPGIAVALAAIAKGATVIEKHFTLDKNLPGPDHKASIEPEELKNMVTGIRQIEKALGNGLKMPSPQERKNIPLVRMSLVAKCAIKKGDTFTAENLVAKRPGTGLSPMRYWDFLGRKADRDYKQDDFIRGFLPEGE